MTSCDNPTEESGPRAAAPTLTISRLCSALESAPELPITVLWTDGEPIEAHFHVTEVGRVRKDFVDCGGTVRRVESCLLQTWVGDDVDHRITAGKLLKAFGAAEAVLGLEDLPVELEYQSCNVVQVRVVGVAREPAGWVIRVGKKQTDCLARDLCVPASGGARAPGPGCC